MLNKEVMCVVCCQAGAALHKYGHMALRRLLNRSRFPIKFVKAPIIAQFSSIGSVDNAWLTDEFRVSLAAGLTTTGSVHSSCP